jgi:tetratricopeptide (TPR) repeat protein
MAQNLTVNEEAQLLQTIEMFEVIAQSQPNDYQSLEILKEAYSRLGRIDDVVGTSKRMAKAYEASGQLSSAILEYESILELKHDDPESRKALAEIASRTDGFAGRGVVGDTDLTPTKAKPEAAKPEIVAPSRPAEIDDGKDRMREVFVGGKYLSASDFDQYWVAQDPRGAPTQATDPFIQVLADKSVMPVEQSLKILCDRSRLCYLPIDKYDMDIELIRSFSRAACLRWCVLPFDKMSKSVLIATANPFNRQAAVDLKGSSPLHLLWYLAAPADLHKMLKKAFR